MKIRIIHPLISLLTSFFINACGTNPSKQSLIYSGEYADSNELTQKEIDSTFGSSLNLSETEGFVTAKMETWFKVSSDQSGDIASRQKCKIEPGINLKFSTLGPLKNEHRLITLEQAPKKCAFKTGFLFDQHVKYFSAKIYYAEAREETRFKKRLADSSTLTPAEWCVIPAGRRLGLKGQAREAASGHAYITFGDEELPDCPFQSGFVFVDHFNQLLEGTSGSEFAKVLKHILIWEGGCSDDPDDPGGRTYKGITTERARQNNWLKDVCTMPDSLIVAIYRKDYWNKRAIHYAWPLNLAIMNTEVNSGGGKAQQFLNRMNDLEIQGTVVVQAAWYVDQQTEFYQIIADINPRLSVFLEGWLNRSSYMQKVIDGRVSLFGEDEIKTKTAKAIAE